MLEDHVALHGEAIGHSLILRPQNTNLIETSYDRARHALVQAVDIDEVKRIRDQAEALRHYALQRDDKQLSMLVAAIRLRADYEIGKRAKALNAIGHRPKKGVHDGHLSKSAILKKASISHVVAARAEQLTEIFSPQEIDNLCEKAMDEWQTAPMIKSTVAYLLQHKSELERQNLYRSKVDIPPQLHFGDFRTQAHVIPDASVELVFTDPPWNEESIPLYEAAAKEAARILKPGGSLIIYAGQMFLDRVLPLLTKHLSYYWTCVQVQDNGVHGHDDALYAGPYPHKPMRSHGIWNGCRLLLWAVKECRGDKQIIVHDTVKSKRREKDAHPWQQPLATAEHFIKLLTSENGLVVDFFCGAGTTAVAAKHLDRPWIAFEMDRTTARVAAARIAHSTAENQT